MIHCSGCGKPIDKLPSWLAGTKVDFVCNNCPNRTAKNIALITLDTEPKPSARLDDDVDEEEVPDDLDEA